MHHDQLIEVVEAWDKEGRSRGGGRGVSISILKRREMPFGFDFVIGWCVVLAIERDNPQRDSETGEIARKLDSSVPRRY